MLFPSEYPEFQTAPTSSGMTRLTASILAIFLSISGFNALSDYMAPTPQTAPQTEMAAAERAASETGEPLAERLRPISSSTF